MARAQMHDVMTANRSHHSRTMVNGMFRSCGKNGRKFRYFGDLGAGSADRAGVGSDRGSENLGEHGYPMINAAEGLIHVKIFRRDRFGG
jgi:hypothetical protein